MIGSKVICSLTCIFETLACRLEALSQRLGPTGGMRPTVLAPNQASDVAAVAGPVADPLATLRAQMGLLPTPGHGLAAQRAILPGTSHFDSLALLGSQLLGSDGGDGGPGGCSSDEGLAAEVLVSAARQHLMAAEAGQLQLRPLELLAADYAALVGGQLEHQLLSR